METSRPGNANRRSVLFCAALCALVSLSTHAQPTLSSSFGFDHQFVRDRYAPLRVTLAGLAEPVIGSLIVKQYLDARAPETRAIRHEIARGSLGNGSFAATIPAHDTVLPLLVQLVADDGAVLASATETTRQSSRGLPLVVVAGEPYHFDGTEAIVAVNELPSDCWAYDGIACVWLTGPLTERSAWMALGEWVSAGGSLAVFSGSDFYQWDSAVVRALLPIEDPFVREAADGLRTLGGIPRSGARIVLSRNGQPLLLRIAYGAGTVSLITTRLRDLTPAELTRIHAYVPRARTLISARSVAEKLLDETEVMRPPYGFAPIVLGILIAGVVWAHRAARKHPRSTAIAVLIGVIALTVACRLYVSREKAMAYEYRVITNLYITTSFGFHTVSSAFFTLDPAVVAIMHQKGAFPMPADAPTSPRTALSLQSALDSTTLAVPAGTRPLLRSYGHARGGFTLTLLDEGFPEFRIDATAPRNVTACLLYADGLFYRVPPSHFAVSLRLTDLRQVSASALNGRETLLYRLVADWVKESAHWWLVALSEDDEHIPPTPLRQKVRVADVDIVAGGRS